MNFPDPHLAPIMMVDDCEDDIFLLRYRLREGGIANPIITFDSPAGALEYIRFLPSDATKPGLVFTDIRMPEPGGFTLISRLREDPEWDSVRIVVVTSSNQPRDLQCALELGVNGYLIKFPPSDLLAEFVKAGPWFSVPRRTMALTHPLSA
jgi:CheY-like chemotaxis protein